MPRPRVDPEQAKLQRQQRNQRYRANLTVKEQNKEHDRIYRQKKREQARLQQHEDPLAQLADIMTQQQYLEVENNAIEEPTIILPIIDQGDLIDVGGVVEEHGEVLDNFDDDHCCGGFNETYDEWDEALSDNGKQSMIIINDRIQDKRGGTAKP